MHAARRPDEVAIRHLRPGRAPEEISWSALRDRVRRAWSRVVANAATDAIVPAYSGKSIETIAMMLGTIQAGRTYAGVSPKFRLPQLLHVLDACKAQAALVDCAGLATVRDGLQQPNCIGSTEWWWLDSSAASPRAQAAAETLRTKACLKTLEELDALEGLADVTGQRVTYENRPAVCLFTSGSTGSPKGVLVSWRDLYRRAVAESELFELTAEDHLLSLLPFSFDVGLNQLMSALVSGARLVILDSWLPADVLRAMAEENITGVSGVPSIWLSVLKSGKQLDRSGPHSALRYVTISGGDMEAEARQRFAEAAGGIAIFKTYGQTETFRSTALRPEDFAARPASVGRAFGTAAVYVVRPDGSRASPDEQGEVVHTGLGTMLGYLAGPDLQQKLRPNPFLGPDDESPFAVFTGDHGHLDEQGYLFLAGRKDDLVKVGGNRVYLIELATEIARIPGVLTAEAVSVPVPGADPMLAVFVLRDTSGPAISEQQVRAEAQRRLPSYMLPQLIQLRDTYPLTASGKPDRVALRAEATALLSPAASAGRQ